MKSDLNIHFPRNRYSVRHFSDKADKKWALMNGNKILVLFKTYEEVERAWDLKCKTIKT